MLGSLQCTSAPGATQERGRRALRVTCQAGREDRGNGAGPRPEREARTGNREQGNGAGQATGRKVFGSRFRGGGSNPLKQVRSVSDGTAHLGSVLLHTRTKAFPGPTADEGPPLRILPIGGLGEIGMNCMMIGHYDRYIVLDCGLMFPDGFEELGVQKVLPDTSFLHRNRDKIEAVVITHGHEDHIGALPWIIPALDPATPIYASTFTLELIRRRMMEFGLWDPRRFKTYGVGPDKRFQLGPFEAEAVRVTHSIPDCCGLFLRCDDGTIVHTGDWKIDEEPIDGENFDRAAFEAIGNEGVTLFMSDSTNAIAPGRSASETLVKESLIRRVQGWDTGRVVATCFASNIHRLESLKAAADATNRKVVLLGMSLNVYLEAAFRDKRATFSPAQCVDPEEMDGYSPERLLVVTTGSQAEPRAMLSRAAYNGARNLKLTSSDLLLYSAKMIPGNEKRITKMLNAIAQCGPEIAMARSENLHCSGHACREELLEVLRLVRPQHFLPVHGEYVFLKEHEALGREAGVKHTAVIRNGQMLGVSPLRSGRQFGRLGTFQLLGEARLQSMYNDGNNGSGTMDDLALEDRRRLAFEGLVVATLKLHRSRADVEAAIAAGYQAPPRVSEAQMLAEERELNKLYEREPWRLDRDERRGAKEGLAASGQNGGPPLQGSAQVTVRAMYTGPDGSVTDELEKIALEAIQSCSAAAEAWEVERLVRKLLMQGVRRITQRRPEVIVNAVDALTPEQLAEMHQGAPKAPARRRRTSRSAAGAAAAQGGAGGSREP